MSTKQWIFNVTVVIVGGLIVLAIAGLYARQQYNASVNESVVGRFLKF